VLAGCATLALIAAFFIVRSTSMASKSMLPGRDRGERVLYSAFSKQPRRGDVIAFFYAEHQIYVKRVIAVGGDHVEMKKGHPVINGWEVPHCRVGAWTYTDEGAPHEGEIHVEFLEDRAYLVFVSPKDEWAFDHGTFVTKPGEYFVLGDNRPNSHDSRMWTNDEGGVGAGVSPRDIQGKVFGGSTPALPKGAEALGPELARCLRERPPLDRTTPPRR
jgi:signal peptidase I